jgi:hypothetical protein
VGGKVAGIKTTTGVWRDAGPGAPGETQVAGREARAGCGAVRMARGGSRGKSIPPTGESSCRCVCGEWRRRRERDVRRCWPTLHRRERSCGGGGLERRGRSTLRRRTLSTGKGVSGGGGHPHCTDGYTPAGGSGGREG